MKETIIKLDGDFSKTGLQSFISWKSLQRMLEFEDKKLGNNDTKFTGFIVDDEGIRIQKIYI